MKGSRKVVAVQEEDIEFKDAPKVEPGYLDADGKLCLKGEQFWRWRALDAEVQLQVLRAAMAKRDLEDFMNRNTEARRLREQLAACNGDFAGAARIYESFCTEVSTAIGEDLKSCSIDDRTGAIHPPQVDAESQS